MTPGTVKAIHASSLSPALRAERLPPTGLGNARETTRLPRKGTPCTEPPALPRTWLPRAPGSRPRGELVVHGDVSEEVGHGLAVVDSANGFGQDQTDVHRLDLGTLQLLHLVRDSICHHHLVDGGLLDQARGLRGQDAVRGHDVDLVRASLFQDLRSGHETLHVVNDVVHYDGDAPADVSHHGDRGLLLGHHHWQSQTRAWLVAEHQVNAVTTTPLRQVVATLWQRQTMQHSQTPSQSSRGLSETSSRAAGAKGRGVGPDNDLTLPCTHLIFFLYIVLVVVFIFLGPHLRHMEVPRLGVQLELWLRAYTTAHATLDP
uniref:Phosphoribosyl pyrophosphate synthase-associated protein 1 isoform X1 n=1 Tax=Sus scrofa TaxID=9823 RepID=A0A480IX48_PIG